MGKKDKSKTKRDPAPSAEDTQVVKVSGFTHVYYLVILLTLHRIYLGL